MRKFCIVFWYIFTKIDTGATSHLLQRFKWSNSKTPIPEMSFKVLKINKLYICQGLEANVSPFLTVCQLSVDSQSVLAFLPPLLEAPAGRTTECSVFFLPLLPMEAPSVFIESLQCVPPCSVCVSPVLTVSPSWQVETNGPCDRFLPDKSLNNRLISYYQQPQTLKLIWKKKKSPNGTVDLYGSHL